MFVGLEMTCLFEDLKTISGWDCFVWDNVQFATLRMTSNDQPLQSTASIIMYPAPPQSVQSVQSIQQQQQPMQSMQSMQPINAPPPAQTTVLQPILIPQASNNSMDSRRSSVEYSYPKEQVLTVSTARLGDLYVPSSHSHLIEQTCKRILQYLPECEHHLCRAEGRLLCISTPLLLFLLILPSLSRLR